MSYFGEKRFSITGSKTRKNKKILRETLIPTIYDLVRIEGNVSQDVTKINTAFNLD